jgi:hypothetical protein
VAATGRETLAAAALKGDARMTGVLAAAVRDRQRVPAATLELPVGGYQLQLDPRTCEQAGRRARETGGPHNRAREVFVDELLDALARQVADRINQGLVDPRLEEEWLESIGPDELLGPALAEPEPAELFGTGLVDGDPSEEELAGIRAELHADPAVRATLEGLWPTLTPQQLLTGLFTSPERLQAAAPDLDPAERALLLRPAAGDGDAGRWTAADVPLLDEAATLLGEDQRAARRAAARRAEQEQRELDYAGEVLAGATIGDAARYAPDTDLLDPAVLAERWRQTVGETIAERARQDRTWAFGHVIVDEAQELSAMAWRMLLRRCPSRSMTVVGDVAQTGVPWGARSWSQTLDPHAPGRWRAEQLTVNYRTPAEIMEVAADVLAAVAPELRPPRSVREAGTAPWRRRLDGAGLPEVIAAEAAAVGDGTLAVLVPAARLEELGRLLTAALPAAAAGQGPSVLDAPIAVLPVAEAKGLEFDAVVVVDPAAILGGSPRGGNDLYVALTRATQRLGVVHGGDLPAVLSRLREQPGLAAG